MDGKSASFHSPEPGHLPFGKLMNSNLQFPVHLFVCQFADNVQSQVLVFRAIEIEEYYAHTPVDERAFPKLNSLIIGVDIDRELRRTKISHRLRQRLDEGMVDEVRRLIEQGIQPDDLIYYGCSVSGTPVRLPVYVHNILLSQWPGSLVLRYRHL